MSDTLKIICDSLAYHQAVLQTLATDLRQTMGIKDIVTIIISLSALIISVLSVWINYLKPFKLKVFNDSPTFSLYKITPQISGSEKGETWWIPSFDIGFSFNNLGKQSGVIYDIRLICKQNERQTKKEYQFYPKWIVDYSKFQKQNTNRLKWINDAVIKEWFTTILPASSSRDFHIILEGDRWDNKFVGRFQVALEIYTSKTNKWVKLSEYDWHVDEDMFEEKSTYTLFDKETNDRR